MPLHITAPRAARAGFDAITAFLIIGPANFAAALSLSLGLPGDSRAATLGLAAIAAFLMASIGLEGAAGAAEAPATASAVAVAAIAVSSFTPDAAFLRSSCFQYLSSSVMILT